MLLDCDVNITEQLATRPERGVDVRAHRGALADIARRMVDLPETVLSRIVELAMELTGAGSAGISVEEEVPGESGVFRWHDVVGRFAPFVGSTLPRDFSPCGTTLDLRQPLLLSRPERAFPYLEESAPIPEVLLVPMYVDAGAPFGTLWVVHHVDGHHFDNGDARTLSELASFGGIAHRVAEDAAAKQILQTALDDRHSRYRVLFDGIDAGFCIIEMVFDEDGEATDYRFIEVNKAFEQQTGLVEASGKLMRDLAPDHEQHWFDLYGRVALTGEPVRFENAAIELHRWYDVHAYRIDEPEARRVAILFHDITARRKAETQLQSLNERLEQEIAARTFERDRLWHISRDPFLIADADGKWARVSPAWTDILGWSEGELLGRTSEWMEHPDDRKKTRSEIVRLSSGETTMRFENRFRTKSGDYRWFSWTAVQAEGMLYCVARDVTDEKQQATALRDEQDFARLALSAVGGLASGRMRSRRIASTATRRSPNSMRSIPSVARLGCRVRTFWPASILAIAHR